ncbi:hypothetical protein JCM10908_000916 [Rhodotorula pacifica]|uniref:uncharacterized protein n=1 Tax=Rhodotorula pacifica TaxID=1495444 RepID=UPI0031784A91
MQTFSNGFQEDDDPLPLSASHHEHAAPTAPTQSANTSNGRYKQQMDTLDLTEDSPEPEILPARPNGDANRSRDSGSSKSKDPVASSARPTGAASGSKAAVRPSGQFARPAGQALASSSGFGQFASTSSSATAQSSSSPQRGSGHFNAPRKVVSDYPPSADSFRQMPNLGQVPVISSAATARVPSAHLPVASTSSAAPRGGFMQPVGSPAAAALAGGTGFSTARILQETQAAFDANKPLSQRIPPPPSPSAAAAANAATAAIKRESQAAQRDLKGKGREDVVDLTADDGQSDEDDIVIDESPVCIGELISYALVLNRVEEIVPPNPPPATRSDGSPWPEEQASAMRARYEQALQRYNQPLPVHIYRDQQTSLNGQKKEMLRLITPVKHEQFGFIDYKAAGTLGELFGDGYHGTGVTQGGDGKLFAEAVVERRGESNPHILRLRLLLFARPFDVPAISRALEETNPPMWLEHPRSYNSAEHGGARYQNPHNPAPGVGSRGADAERRRHALVSGIYGGSSINAQKVVKAIDVQKQQVEEVFLNLKSGTDLEQVTPPPIVSTTLYPHQKQALAFLLDRETLVKIPEKDVQGQPPAMVSLWQRKSDPYGKVKGWTNLVTDLEIPGERPPPQARGAILADDMGLGKTIVVISLVCTTLHEARDWAKEAPTKDKLDARFDDKVKASEVQGRSVGVNDFQSRIPGADLNGASTSAKPLSKKKQAKQRREKAKEEAVQLRFEKLVCRSRATLIVCPLSTVQNWESQFEEHTTAVERDSHGGKSITIEADSEVRRALKRKMRVADSDDEDGDFVVKDDDDSDDISDASMKSDSFAGCRSKKSALKIYIYHGASRCDDPKRLADHDVVITTFSTLATEYSKQVRADEEREDEEELAAKRAAEEEDGIVEVFGFGPNGEILTSPPGQDPEAAQKATKEKEKKAKRKRKRVEGSGVSPLQAIQWFRVVLDEAHIIKEARTIQARAACDLSTSRRICLTGTPLQNSLNDIFSLIRFIRLEPFLDRHVWNQYVGVLAQKGDALGAERLKVIMRHLALRRTKDTKDSSGKPILSLPPIDSKLIKLDFSETERAFYSHHHARYKHDFAKLEETDSVMKNFCSILQELLKLRQICVHPALLQDSQDRAAAAGEGGGDLVATIEKHGITKPRAVQLLALMLDAGGGGCLECGFDMPAFARAEGEEGFAEDDASGCAGNGKPARKPVKKARKATKLQSAPTSAATSDDDSGAAPADDDIPYIVTRCQHTFCPQCFRQHMSHSWPQVKSDDKAQCRICQTEFQPAVDAVEIHPREYAKAMAQASDQNKPSRSKNKKHATRLFEHSTKTRHLLADLLPFSMVNPSSDNYDPTYDPSLQTAETGGTIGFQPVRGEVVKSVVFSQWTTLLDRLGDALEDQHIRYDRLDGAMNREQRNAAMEAFKVDPRCEVLLVSLRAGGVGLNLTAGRRVYLMEPFWNPAVENQAVDRIYRLGQTKSVQTIRFVMQKTIEDNMLKIQQRKKELAQMSVGRTLSKLELAQQRKDELRILLA